MGSYPHDFPTGEAFEGDLLYRTSDQAECPRGVVDNASLPDVDAVMQVTSPGRHQMCPGGGLLARCQTQVRVRLSTRPGCK
jgi:hypothetical protein